MADDTLTVEIDYDEEALLSPTMLVSTASSVSFLVTATAGLSIIVDWGDDTDTETFAMTGSAVSVSRNYGSSEIRTIRLTNDNDKITSLDCSSSSITSLIIEHNTDIATLDCSSNALPSSEINKHLEKLIDFSFLGTYDSSGQTPSAPPTGDGVADKATLITNGATVTTD